MINDKIEELLEEVHLVRDSMDEGSSQRILMTDVGVALSLAHSLVHEVNKLQLARLMNGDR